MMEPMNLPRSTATFVMLFAAAGLALSAQTQTPIDNDQVRVLQVTDQPHTKSSPDEHKLNRVMVYLEAGRQEITPQNGRKTIVNLRRGGVRWSPATGTQVSEITSNAPVGMVEVEIKKPGDPAKKVTTALDPLKVAPKIYKLEFENGQVRVIRVKIGPKQVVPTHEHVLNRVVIYLTDQNTRITTTDGKVEMAQHKAGEASWGGPATHKEENLSDMPFEAVVVELKN